MTASRDGHEDHPHSEERHVHGEPSRVLEGDPYPSAALLYGAEGGPVGPEDRDHWHDRLVGGGFVERVFGAGLAPSEEDPPSSGSVEFASSRFRGFDDRLGSGPLLFVPAGLRTEAEVWEDLASNDVTVSWLAVDPDGKNADRPRVAVLSDWVVQVGDGVPSARSAGTAPGVFHVAEGHREAFEQSARSAEGFTAVFNRFLERDGVKVRPGFLRGGSWESRRR